MPQRPGSLSSVADAGDGGDEGWLGSRLRDLQRQIDELRTARTGNAMTINGAPGIVVKGGGQIELDGGDLNVTNGDVVVSGGNVQSGNFMAGSAGYRLRSNGNAEFNDITLRGGIVGNDALASPISPARAHAQATNFSLTTTAVQKASVSITVPSGYSRALALATISATAVNKWTGQDFFAGYADVNVAGSPGGYLAAADGQSGYAIGISHTEIDLVTSLGATIQFRAMLQSGSHSWAADPFNTVNLDALVLFLR